MAYKKTKATDSMSEPIIGASLIMSFRLLGNAAACAD